MRANKKTIAKTRPGTSGVAEIDGVMQRLYGQPIVKLARSLVPPSATRRHRSHRKYCTHACAAVLANLLRGHWPASAAQLAGYDRRTVVAWRKDFPDFDEAVLRAESMHEDRLLRIAHMHAATDPATCMKMLAVRYPERWQPTEKRDLKVQGEMSVIPLSVLPAIHAERRRLDAIDIEEARKKRER